MSDATNDRGAKPPRTLFSLGRPGAKKDTPSAAPGDETPTDALPTDTEAAATAEVESPGVAFEESGFLCGACDAPLPVGAVFCAECGTPVAALDEDSAEPVAAGPAAIDDPDHPQPPVVAPVFEAPAASEPADVPFEPVEEPAEAPGAAEAVTGAPAAILYADPSQAEPLPPQPEGSWGIAEPATGTSDGTYLYGDAADATGPDPANNTWAEPAAAVAVAAAGVVAGAELAGATPSDATAVAPVVPSAGASGAAPPLAGSGGTGAGAMPYGHGPVGSTEKKSKTGLIVGAAAAAVLVLVIGGVVLASGGNKDAGSVQTAQQATTSTTATAKATTTTSPGPTSTTDKATTTAVATTVTTEAPTSSTPATTGGVVTTAVPTTPRPTVAPTQPAPPTTLLQPGKISASPANGATVNIPKGGSTQIVLQNTGGAAASCTISSGSGNLSVSPNCSPSVPAGGSVTITVKANPGFEGQGSVQGLMEGIGSYNITVFVKNG